MNGIENFLLRGREKRCDRRVRNVDAARRGAARREERQEKREAEKDRASEDEREDEKIHGLNERRRRRKTVKVRREREGLRG